MSEKIVPSFENIKNSFSFFVSTQLLLDSAREKGAPSEYLETVFQHWKLMQLNVMESQLEAYSKNVNEKLSQKDSIEQLFKMDFEDVFTDVEDLRKVFIESIDNFEKGFWEGFKKNV